jgi:hypothetical protein
VTGHRPGQRAIILQAPEVFPDATTAVPPPPRPPPPLVGRGPKPRSRFLQFALFVAALLWFLCSEVLAESAAKGITYHFNLGDEQPLLAALFLLFLLICGFAVLRLIERRRAPLRLTLGFPQRRTSREEWATGGAIGWGVAAVSILPLVLRRGLNIQLWTAPRAFELLALGVATLAVVTFAHSLAIFGYGFQRLIEATGAIRATLIVVTLVAIHAGFLEASYGTPDGVRILVEMLSALILCVCWFRTHGLWLGWGLHFAWAASSGILFGLPLAGDLSFSSVVDTRVAGPVWLTGGSFGPAAAGFTLVLLLATIPILIRITTDYAWNYTHPPIIPAGYDVTIAPPAAHVAMEQSALTAQPVNPASLVQILPSTPQNPVSGKASE